MIDTKLGEVESRFADIIWQNAPISSGALAQIARKELGWKKSTTYTVLKRLCDRGIFFNEGGTVAGLVTKEEFQAMQSERFVQDTFHGSLPAFLAAFATRKKLSEEEITHLRQVIDAMKG